MAACSGRVVRKQGHSRLQHGRGGGIGYWSFGAHVRDVKSDRSSADHAWPYSVACVRASPFPLMYVPCRGFCVRNRKIVPIFHRGCTLYRATPLTRFSVRCSCSSCSPGINTARSSDVCGGNVGGNISAGNPSSSRSERKCGVSRALCSPAKRAFEGIARGSSLQFSVRGSTICFATKPAL